MKRSMLVALALGTGIAFGGTLTWNGGSSGAWNKTDANWLDANSQAVAWTDGETAVVPAGAQLDVTEPIAVDGLVLGHGAVVGGRANVSLSGDVEVASDCLASLAAPVWAGTALAKTGAGDLAANRLSGPISVNAGRLLTGGLYANRALVTENGGTRVWQAADATAADLIANGSFEQGGTTMPAAGYVYVNGATMPVGWDGTVSGRFVWLNATGSTSWGNSGALGILDGTYAVGFQRNANASQTITVPADGFYDLSYYTYKRTSTNNDNHLIDVTVDGLCRFAQLSIWSVRAHPRVSTGPIWLTAGSHVLKIEGEDLWGDCTTFMDDVQLRACGAGSAVVTPNETIVADGDSAAAVAPLADTSSYEVPHLTKLGDGTTTIPGEVDLSAEAHFTVQGTLAIDGLLKGVSQAVVNRVVKTGPGVLAIRGNMTNLGLDVYEGTLDVNIQGQAPVIRLRTHPGSPSTVMLRTAADFSSDFRLQAYGTGRGARFATAGTGFTYASALTAYTTTPDVTFDVGTGDVLSLFGIQPTAIHTVYYTTDVVKEGAGTLRITGTLDSATQPTRGVVEVRDGTFDLRANDLMDGAPHPITGAPVVTRSGLGLPDRTLTLAPAGIAATATPRVLMGAANVASVRPIAVGPGGASATLEGVAGETALLGPISLGRATTTATGPNAGAFHLGVLSRAAGFASTATLAATGAVTVEGATGAGVGVTSTGSINFGRASAVAATLDALSLSGAYGVDFGVGVNDCVTAGTLTLGATELSLRNLATGEAFADAGTFVLFRYDALVGDPELLLSVATASRTEGLSYEIRHDAQAKTVSLVISAAATSPIYTWAASGGGAWATGSNWDHGTAPGDAAHQAVFGNAATAAATVTVEGSRTVHAIRFANLNGYTLSGGAFACAPDGEARPTIRADYGTNVVTSAVGSTDGGAIHVSCGPSGVLVFDGTVNAPLVVTGGTVTFGSHAQLNAAVTYAHDFTGSGTLVKTGTDVLAVGGDAGADHSFSGTVDVKSGSLRLGAPPLWNATVDLAAGATLTTDDARHGLRATYRRFPDRNANGYNAAVGKIYDLAALKSHLAGCTVVTNVFYDADGLVLADTNAPPATIPADCRQGGAWQDYWGVVFEGTLFAPSSGWYLFQGEVDDAFVLAVDGVRRAASRGCQTGLARVHLERGPHAVWLCVLEYSGNAKFRLKVQAPGDAALRDLPAAWLAPRIGAKATVGGGVLAPKAGTALTLGVDSGFSTAFAGTLAGETGSALVKSGEGRVTLAGWSGGDIVLEGGEIGVVAPGGVFDAVDSNTGANTLGISGASSIVNLYGGAKVALGEHLYWSGYSSDADCAISPNRAYTHLLSFPTSGDSNPAPVVNGVTFNTVGVDAYSISNPPSAKVTSAATTGHRSLYQSFNYASTDYSITLSGLVPHGVYDLRFYWMNYGVGTNGDGNRTGTFTFSVKEGGTTRTIERHQRVLESAGSTKGSAFCMVGCRYYAGSDGKVTLRVQSGTAADTVHLYALTNERLGDGTVTAAPEAVTVAPAAGTRSVFTGELAGTPQVTVGGAGEQVLGGILNLGKPLNVAGRLVLANGGQAKSGLAFASGASLEMRGGSSVSGLSGTAPITLPYGDRRPYGALRDDGTFAPLAPLHVQHFTGDADCGVSPSKNYLCAFNYRSDLSRTSFNVVNEVPFRQAAPTAGMSVDSLDARDPVTGGVIQGTPWTVHAGSSGYAYGIGVPSSEGIYQILYAMAYAGNQGNKRLPLTISGLTVGKTYELRFYERTWAENSLTTRNAKFEFDPAGSLTATTNATIAIDGEGRLADGSYCPYTIGIRFTAALPSNIVYSTSLNGGDTWHVYGATLEEYDPGANVRTFDLAADTAFGGAISGIGEVAKTGAGVLTLGGAVNARGFWSVKGGGVVLTDAAQTLGSVAVAGNAAFGGTGAVAEDLGVAAGATLKLTGPLTVGGKLAVGEGATVEVAGKAGATAATLALPSALAVKPVSKLIGSTALFTNTADLTGTDFSGWTVYKPDGVSVDAAAKFALSSDGKSVVLKGNNGTAFFVR